MIQINNETFTNEQFAMIITEIGYAKERAKDHPITTGDDYDLLFEIHAKLRRVQIPGRLKGG